MNVEKLAPSVGARIDGVDLKRIDAQEVSRLRALLEEHLVLFFEDQNVLGSDLDALGCKFGQLEVAPNLPALSDDLPHVHFLDYDGNQPRGVYSDQWHSDHSFEAQPNFSSFLSAEILPPEGGDTLWASMYAAYDALSQPLKDLCDNLQAVHGRSDQEVREGLGVVHPVVRVHPRTGRRALYVNSVWTRSLVGVSKTESQAILDFLYAHCAMPDFQVRWRWTPGALAMWDNRFTQHYAILDYQSRRRMQRVTIVEGEVPLGPRDWQVARPRAEALEGAA